MQSGSTQQTELFIREQAVKIAFEHSSKFHLNNVKQVLDVARKIEQFLNGTPQDQAVST